MTSANIDFWKKFIGTVIDEKKDFEKNPKNPVVFDLKNKLIGEPGYNGKIDEPKDTSGWIDKVEIDHMEKYVTDEVIFAIASGANGDNIINGRRFKEESFGANTITSPDVEHMFYGGNATSKTTLTDSDRMSASLIWKVKEKCKIMNDNNYMHPITIGPEKYYIMVLSPVQVLDMRHAPDHDNSYWESIKKEVKYIEEEVKNDKYNHNKHLIFSGAFGIINNVILHKTAKIRLFNDYGSKQNIKAARALFLGNQSLIFANDPSSEDNICGIKKTKYKDRDYSICTVDTAYSLK